MLEKKGPFRKEEEKCSLSLSLSRQLSRVALASARVGGGLDALLDDVVAVLVVDAEQDVSPELGDDLQREARREHLQGLLHHSAAVDLSLMCVSYLEEQVSFESSS